MKEVIVFTDIYHVIKGNELGFNGSREVLISCRDISNRLDGIISREKVRKVLIDLEKKELIHIRRDGQTKYYSLAKDLNNC